MAVVIVRVVVPVAIQVAVPGGVVWGRVRVGVIELGCVEYFKSDRK